jgi:heme exporter protein A
VTEAQRELDPELAPPAPLLAGSALSFSRDGELVFGPLDLAVHAGEVLVVEGDNGSGKTSLVRILAGLASPVSGTLTGLSGGGSEVGAVAVLGHQLALKSELTPLENLRFRMGLVGARSGAAPGAALASVGLEGYEDVPVRRLSQGQRKRVALAALLTSPATLWLLDEPYANLDRSGRVLVDRMLEAHTLRGGAAVITSHGLIQPQVAKTRYVKLVQPSP